MTHGQMSDLRAQSYGNVWSSAQHKGKPNPPEEIRSHFLEGNKMVSNQQPLFIYF